MPRPQPPEGFVTIGEGIYISNNNSIDAGVLGPQPDESAPNVILIFGWMGALTRHLQSYTREYAQLYPTATQILVKCGPSFIWTTEQAKRKRLLPVVKALESLGCIPVLNGSAQDANRPRPRILVHSFSNGGSVQLTTLGRLLASKYPSLNPSEHLISALILDSSPAVGNVRTIYAAFTIAIRNPVARHIALFLIYIAHAIRLAMSMIVGKDFMVMEYMKSQLFKPKLLPWMNAKTPRLYIYSKKDELVPWQEVQKHAETAKTLGLDVSCEVYEESAHVAHMRVDPKRYWACVQAHWRAAYRDGAGNAIEAN